MPKSIFFDLEGPLSPQDNAYEVMSLIGNGDRIFEVISRYDDVIALEGRDGYEPGDTLALIIPFLLWHGITEEDIRRVSDRAKIIDGAPQLISKLREEGWHVHIISTSYEQHAYNVGKRVGVEKENITCTRLSLKKLREKVNDLSIMKEVENEILNLFGKFNRDNLKRLDEFFYGDLYDVFSCVKVIGGARKVDAMLEMAGGTKTERVFVVGDSITDYKMLSRVKDDGGVSVVFNGNEYAVPYGNVALASSDIRFLYPLTKFDMREDMMEFVGMWEAKRPKIKGKGFPYFHCLEDASEEKINEVIKIHREFRERVRGEAAKLG
jgi:energy-converting hydrogenase A subunit R